MILHELIENAVGSFGRPRQLYFQLRITHFPGRGLRMFYERIFVKERFPKNDESLLNYSWNKYLISARSFGGLLGCCFCFSLVNKTIKAMSD